MNKKMLDTLGTIVTKELARTTSKYPNIKNIDAAILYLEAYYRYAKFDNDIKNGLYALNIVKRFYRRKYGNRNEV